MSSARDELHRLVDELPVEALEQVGAYLRAVVKPQRPRRFRFAGMGEGPSDLGARAKGIARGELGATE